MARIKMEIKDRETRMSFQDKPAASLLKSWGKRMSQGVVAPIPVYVGGSWSVQIPRGNKRVLQLAVGSRKG